MRATGHFDVRLTPAPTPPVARGLGRMTLDKDFHGDLSGSSRGEMLTAMGETKGSGAYVAVERVTGTLGGRSGSFALSHSGVMQGGTQQLSINVVPDSGTGELAGICGRLELRIEGGKHEYVLEYELP